MTILRSGDRSRDRSCHRLPAALAAAVALASVCVAGPALANFRVTRNAPFAARVNGPMGALIVPDSGATRTPHFTGHVSAARVATAMASAPTTQALHTQSSDAMLQRASRGLRLLEAHGALHHGLGQISFPRIMVHTTPSGQLVLPDLVASRTGVAAPAAAGTTAVAPTATIGDPSNDITVTFQGFDDATTAEFQDYLRVAYPVARKIYGPPAFNIAVTCIEDPNVTNLEGGYYDVTNNEIHMAPPTGNANEDTFVLMVLLLHAFHDDAFVYFNSWEDGMAGAAATAIQTTPGVAPGYLAYDPGPFYCLSVYDCENQPALGNPTFYDPSASYSGMLVWRIAMARAAWYKCYIEDPNFFANFNAQYYAQYSPSLAGDTLGLKDVAASVLPQVEGEDFYDWYEQQYVLDTSIHVGPKLFTWNIPLSDACALIIENYITDSTGSETPQGGTAMTIYWAYDFSVSLYAEEGNVVSIPSTGDGAGEGFIIPTFFNVGGAQRVTVQVDINGLRGYYTYPFSERGFDTTSNNIYGGIIDGLDGTVDISGAATASAVTVGRGVWGTIVESGTLSPGQITVTYTSASGDKVTRTVNVGWDSYCLLLQGGTQQTINVTYPSGTSLIALPIYPLTPSAPDLLGVSSSMLLLARWDPRLNGTGDYHIWPNIDGFSPGKGYWAKFFASTPVTAKGILPDPTADFSVPLSYGWNMFGSPRLGNVNVSDLEVQNGTDPAVSWSDAVNDHLVQSTIYGYTDGTGYVPATVIQAYYGYWIRSLVNGEVRLIFPANVGTSSVRSTSATATSSSSTNAPVVSSPAASSASTTSSGPPAAPRSGSRHRWGRPTGYHHGN